MKISRCSIALACLLALTACALLSPPPMVVIKAEPRFGVAPLKVVFDGTDSHDADGIRSYEWELASGVRRMGETASYTYPAGEHTITLRATDGFGAVGEGTTIIHVRPDPSGKWVGALILDPSDTRPAGLELDLDWDGETLSGAVTFGFFGNAVEALIVESEAGYDRLYIRAERLAPVKGMWLCVIELEAVPGEILTGTATIEGEEFDWAAVRD